MSNKASHYRWSTINRFGSQVISFGGNIIIARILIPDDFGLVAMLSIFIAIAMNIADAGFDDCLIRKADADEKDFSTIFVYNISLGFFLFLLLFLCAPLIARFYGRMELVEITRVLSLSIFFQSFTLTQITRFRKNLQFKKLAQMQIAATSVAVITGIVLALCGMGYWALVFQNIATPLITIIILVFVFRWRPVFHFSLDRYKQMRGFSLNLLTSYFLSQIGNNIYSVVIGKFQKTSILGFYNQATKINDSFFQSINAIILTTSYPILAKETDKVKRKEMYKSLLRNFLFIHFNLSFLVIGGAFFIIPFVFGEKWLGTAGILQLLTLSFLFYPLMTINSNIIKIEGHDKLYRNLTVVRMGLSLVALAFTYKYSIQYIMIGQIVARYVSVVIDILCCGRTISFGLFEQFFIVQREIWTPMVSALLAYFITSKMEGSLSVFVYLFLYGLVCLALNFLFKNPVQKTFLSRVFKKTV